MATQLKLAHSVYFSLRDNSPGARQKLAAACKKYLTGHPGTVFFAAGTLAEDIRWSVSDCEFDVALHVVFESRAAHDAYQDSSQHQQFLEENEGHWTAIRVFDAYVEERGNAGSSCSPLTACQSANTMTLAKN